MRSNNALVAFNFANDNTRRLRSVENQAEDFANVTEERELDYKGRLIEIFGRPFIEDIGLTGTYPGGYDGPDLYHFAYVEPSKLLDVDRLSATTTFSATFLEPAIDPDTGVLITDRQTQTVEYNVSTTGLGLIKPTDWGSRPEPGQIQLARSEVLQALGRYLQGLDRYESQIEQIESQADLLESLYQLNRNTLQIQTQGLQVTQSLNQQIISARVAQRRFRGIANKALTMANAVAAALPKSLIAGFSNGGDFSFPVRGAIRKAGSLLAGLFNSKADNQGLVELQRQQDQQVAAAQQQLQITGWQGNYQVEQQIANLRQLVRVLPGLRLELYMLEEAMNQATGRYQGALGRGLRLWEQRTAFRRRSAVDVSEFRFQDMAFRVFRNDALQKYRAQFDLAARYVFLAAKAFDYETNLFGASPDSGERFLDQIVRERSIGTIQNTSPVPGSGLAGQLAELSQTWLVLKPQLGFNNATELSRTFKLRWELFRIPRSVSFDSQWRDLLSSFVIDNLNEHREYNQFAQLLQDPPDPNPAIVIPFSTSVSEGLNLFGWLSSDDTTLPSENFATKIHQFEVRLSNYPAPLNEPANVYVIPIGTDVSRVPTCPVAPIRTWNLLDQTLPVSGILTPQDLQIPTWQPWDELSGGAAGLVRRRLIPTVGAWSTQNPNRDISFKLTGRSLWNTRWLLIIPGSSLQGADPAAGIDTFINGTNGTGVRDIWLQLKVYGYSGCLGP